MNGKDALVLIFERNAFYKRLHYLAIGVFVLCLAIIAILTFVAIHLYRHPTQPLFFATDEVTHLIQVVPVDTPNMATVDVLKWASEAV